MGKPVVATRVGYVNFAIEDNVNGFLIEEGDKEGFAKAIIRLAKDKELCREFGTSGHSKAARELTWYQNVERFIAPLND